MASITPFGAAGEVTGSAYLVETEDSTILVDFGMFQGDKDDDAKNVVPGRIHRAKINAVVLTHAHLDHSGRLPLLVREGYSGPIFSTPATRDLAGIILDDSAHIQEIDYQRHLRHASRRNRRVGRADQPLYDADDVADTMKLFQDVNYSTPTEITGNIIATFHEAGHMLGSASVSLEISEGGSKKTIVFSGDIGPENLPFLRDPQPPVVADIVVMESTYGNRNHRSIDETIEEFASIFTKAINERSRVFIPSFAIGRAQNILFYISELIREKKIPAVPIFLDSPMAIEASRMYARYHTLFDEESTELLKSGAFNDGFRTLRFSKSAQDSMAINTMKGPFVVIAGAGMCNAGRILHHLRHSIEDPNAHVIIVGYQSHGSLGRYLVDGARNVSIMGKRYTVKANIHTLGGFSAHAGQDQLLEWADAMNSEQTVYYLTHGENDAREELQQLLHKRLDCEVVLPRYAQGLTV